ncbi:MAG: hypothetical protein H6669_09915 [Ardenticatenaceae bacterium]|nr:hypothetical protein [Ardenticatenaceae bacterium]
MPFRNRITRSGRAGRERERRIAALLNDEDELLGKAYDGRLVRRLLQYLSPYKRLLWAAIVYMIVSSLLGRIRPASSSAKPSTRAFAPTPRHLAALDDPVHRCRCGRMDHQPAAHRPNGLRGHQSCRRQPQRSCFIFAHAVVELPQQLQRRLDEPPISGRAFLRDFITGRSLACSAQHLPPLGIVVAMLLNWWLALAAFAVIPLMLVLTNYCRACTRSVPATWQRLSLINGYLNESGLAASALSPKVLSK